MTSEAHTPEAARPGLTWPIKASFVAYVLGMEDGELSASDGATTSATNVFAFEPAPASALAEGAEDTQGFDSSTRQGRLNFRGDVRFVAHHGMLTVQISNPTIEVGQESALLTAGIGAQRIPLALLALPEPELGAGRLAWRKVLPRLTSAGSDLFNGVYPAGQELDLLDIIVAL